MGNEIWRADKKIGWVEGNHIFAYDAKKLGYFEGNYIYDVTGKKIAYIEEDFLVSVGERESKTRLENISEAITGGVLPEIAKCAVYVLLGS